MPTMLSNIERTDKLMANAKTLRDFAKKVNRGEALNMIERQKIREIMQDSLMKHEDYALGKGALGILVSFFRNTAKFAGNHKSDTITKWSDFIKKKEEEEAAAAPFHLAAHAGAAAPAAGAGHGAG